MKIIDNIPFECEKCGKCCKWDGFVFLTPEDIKKISEYLKLTIKDFINRFTKKEQGFLVLINKGYNKECIFLDNNKCKIWDYKPKQCDDFPIKYNKDCPGFKKGVNDYNMSEKNNYETILNNQIYRKLYSNIKTKSIMSVIKNSSIDPFLEDSRNVIKISRLDDLYAFERIGNKHLIHKCTRDLWVLDTDKNGNIKIKRLFDNKGEPIKG